MGISYEAELDTENFLSRHFPTLMQAVQRLKKVIGQDVSSAQQEETPRSFNEPNPQTSGTHGNRNKPQESYEQLSILLAEKKWKEADWETMQILLRIAERTEQGWLLSIDEIPSEDIRKIDLLVRCQQR